MEDTKVYLLLTDTGSLLSQTIKRVTRKKYNHCSLAFDCRLESTYSFGRKKPDNPFIGGFVQEDTLSDFFLRSDCAVYSLTITKEQAEALKKFIRRMEAEQGAFHYNLLGLVAVLLEREWHREHHYFCSQFVAAALQEGGIFQPEKPLSLMTPQDLLAALPFECLYEGSLHAYHQAAGSQAVPGFYMPEEAVTWV